MMLLDKSTIGRKAKELGFVRDTLEKVYRLVDVLNFFLQMICWGIPLR